MQACDEHGDIVRVSGKPEFAKESVAGFLQGVVGCVKQAPESVEAFVDGLMTDLDESVGVQDQPITGADGKGRGDERDAADPERDTGRQVEQFRGLATAHQDGGRWPAMEMWHSARCGS